jgi:hypothetical protein
MKTISWKYVLDQVGTSFVHSLAAAISSAGVAFTVGSFDWRAALVGAVVGTVLSALKVTGVASSLAVILEKAGVPEPLAQAAQTAVQDVEPILETIADHGAPTQEWVPTVNAPANPAAVSARKAA